jgi:hypothetical protein
MEINFILGLLFDYCIRDKKLLLIATLSAIAGFNQESSSHRRLKVASVLDWGTVIGVTMSGEDPANKE